MTAAELPYGEAVASLRARDLVAAEAALGRALALDPAHAPSLHLLGVLAGRADDRDRAVALLRRAVAAGTREQARASGLLLGAALRRWERPEEAEAVYRAVLHHHPDDGEALLGLGLALREGGRPDEAVAMFERAHALDPGAPAAAFDLATALKGQGRTDEAVAVFRALVDAAPALAAARIALLMAHLPPVYRDAEEIARRHADYVHELEALIAFADAAGPGALADGIGAAQPFLLPYAGFDDVPAQRRYGALACRAIGARYPALPLAPPAEAGERIRVGIVSGHFRDHSVWRLPARGWVTHLDRAGFELFGYHTSGVRDAETGRAAAMFDTFRQGPLTPDRWRELIAGDRLHALVYPEIGMDPIVARLAAMRLARAQYTSWGHPATSGYPTIDFFLSSAAMEPHDADDRYSERLVRLPGLSTPMAVDPERPPAPPRAALGVPDDAVVYWCGQTLSKYLPHHDPVFARIAGRVPESRFLFVASPESRELTARFAARLAEAFRARGLDAGRHCIVLPRMEPHAFKAAIGCADVVLDSIGWSGCNSLLDALCHELPIVTLPGDTMRSRHGAAILAAIGAGETVCTSLTDYVEQAVAYGRASRSGGKTRPAYDVQALADRSGVAALEHHLRSTCQVGG